MNHMRFWGNLTKRTQAIFAGFGLLLVAIVVIAVVFFRNYSAEHDPTGAFWDAMSATMTTSGVTCGIHNVADGLDSRNNVSLDLAGKTNARSEASIAKAGTIVSTEILSTAHADYIRYTKITIPKKVADDKSFDFSKIINVWTNKPRDNSEASLFDQTSLGGCVVPLADLKQSQASSLVADMRKSNVFQTDTQAAMRAKLHGQSVFKYKVKFTPDQYVPFMQRFAKAYGLQSLNNLSTSTFSDKAALNTEFLISARQHRLLEITFDGQQHTIDFSDYGKPPVITLPQHPISFTDLQKRLQGLQ